MSQEEVLSEEHMDDYLLALWPHNEPAVDLTRPAQILDVAASLFYRKGYAATTMREIAEGAGLLKGSIYHYFPSKEEILNRIIWSVHFALTSALEPIYNSDLECVEKLRRILWTHTLYNAKNIEWTTVFYTDFGALLPDNRKAIIKERDRYDLALTDIIDEARDQNLVSTDIPSKFIRFAFTGLVNSLHAWYDPDGPYSAEAVAGGFAELALHGVLGESAWAWPDGAISEDERT